MVDLAGHLKMRTPTDAGILRLAGVFAAIAIIVGVFVRGPYMEFIATLAFAYAFATTGLNIVYGYAGQPAFGHPVFFGVGAYVSSLLAIKLGWPVALCILVAGPVTATLSLLVASTSARLKGASFGMVTLALTSVAYIIAQNWIELTNGPMGVRDIPALPSFAGSPATTMIGLTALLGIAVAAVNRLLHSRIGRAWLAVRENEALASSVGVSPVFWRIQAFATGAFFVGIGGAIYAHTVRYLDPTILTWNVIAVVFIMLVGGGSGTLIGPVLGAFVFSGLPELLRFSESARDLLLGLVLVLTLAFMPEGMIGIGDRIRNLWKRSDGLDSADAAISAAPPTRAAQNIAARKDPVVRAAIFEVAGVAKSFGGLKVLTDVSFSVHEDEIVGIVGPNGAGKTTLFNIITGFAKSTAGQVRICGQRLDNLTPSQVAACGVCRTFQITSVFPKLTVAENIRAATYLHVRSGIFGALMGTKGFRKAEERAELSVRTLLDLTGLTNVRDNVASGLSYGQQRLLEIGVALATGCRLLLLDEPAAGLNPYETEQLRRLLLDLRGRGRTIVIIEHDMHFISRLCDRIIVLHRGVKLSEGPPGAVLKEAKVIEAYLGGGSESDIER
jgi:ABC-type branched-subunit amino acid transport system ATPase component/ABC-type branched-subunit amino acid transport system permease subunit